MEKHIESNERLYKLFRIHCEDLLVLAEMEHNGMVFDAKAARQRASELQKDCDLLAERFKNLSGCEFGNIGSGDCCSAILYGGDLQETYNVPIGIYKSGKRQGQIKYKKETIIHEYPRLVEPIKDQETAKSRKLREEGKTDRATQWSVAEDVLKKLKAKGKAKELINIILKYRELEKLRGTYLEGWSKLIEKQHWEEDMIHGQLSQCVVVTGRLASSKPNLQNADKETKKFLISRYKDG